MTLPLKPAPSITGDSRPYWEGAANGRLMLQQCGDCGAITYLPRAVCPSCWSLNRTHRAASGRGTVHSFTLVHRAPLPAFQADCPYVVAMIDLEEGPRMVANILGDDARDVRIGDPVEVCFEDRGEIVLPQFRLAKREVA